MTNIKNIVCDLGGVLINLNVPRCIDAFEALMGKDNLRNVLGMDEEGEGVKSVSVASRQLMADFERGLIKSDDFIKQIRTYCHPDTTDEMVQNAWMAMLGDLPQERLERVAQWRKQGYHLYLLSNGNELHFEYINRRYHLDRYFERMFLSQEMHSAKPEPEIFRQVNETIGGNEKNTVFIDDLETNRLAATAIVCWQCFDALQSVHF